MKRSSRSICSGVALVRLCSPRFWSAILTSRISLATTMTAVQCSQQTTYRTFLRLGAAKLMQCNWQIRERADLKAMKSCFWRLTCPYEVTPRKHACEFRSRVVHSNDGWALSKLLQLMRQWHNPANDNVFKMVQARGLLTVFLQLFDVPERYRLLLFGFLPVTTTSRCWDHSIYRP